MIIPVPSPLPKWNGISYGLHGLGQDDGDDGSGTDWIDLPITDLPVTPTSSVYPIAAGPPATTTTPGGGTVNIYPTTTTTGAAPPSSGVNNSNLTASTINTLVTAGTQIGKTLAAEAAPSGSQLLYNAQGQLISSTSALSSLTSGSSSTLLIYIGLAALAFMALEKH